MHILRNPNSRLHTKLQLSSLKNKKVGKSVQSTCCAVVKCALCSGVRSDLSARFKRPGKEELMLRVSLKLLEKQRRCAQISPSAFLSIAPFKCKVLRYSRTCSLHNTLIRNLVKPLYNIHAHIVGGSEKVQHYAGIIHRWSLTEIQVLSALDFIALICLFFQEISNSWPKKCHILNYTGLQQ